MSAVTPGDGAVGRPRRVAENRKPGRPPHGTTAKRTGSRTVRLQIHLDEQTAQRLGVHCSLVQRDRSAMVGEVLLGWLSRYGRGRELFGTPEDLEGPGEGQGPGP
jgi:hypothetical protein